MQSSTPSGPLAAIFVVHSKLHKADLQNESEDGGSQAGTREGHQGSASGDNGGGSGRSTAGAVGVGGNGGGGSSGGDGLGGGSDTLVVVAGAGGAAGRSGGTGGGALAAGSAGAELVLHLLEDTIEVSDLIATLATGRELGGDGGHQSVDVSAWKMLAAWSWNPVPSKRLTNLSNPGKSAVADTCLSE